VDRESGLGDYSARKYDGENGEFPTVDEWWERYRSTSPYVYSFDNPVRLSDPSGRGGGVTGPRVFVEEPDMGGGADLGEGAFALADEMAGAQRGKMGLEPEGSEAAGGGVSEEELAAAEKAAESEANNAKSDKTAEDNISLYRAVSPSELKDLQDNNGKFRNPKGVESKYFSTTPDGASSYAKQSYKAGGAVYEGPYTVVSTETTAKFVNSSMTVTVDGGIPTVVIPTAQLSGLTPAKLLNFTPLPSKP
jgi:RHS repeat-associated protein